MNFEAPAHVVRLKALVWLHAALGAALLVGFIAATLSRKPDSTLWGLVLCGLLWSTGLAPLYRKADALDFRERASGTGLPGWMLIIWFVGELLSVYQWALTDYAQLLLVVHLLAGVTLLLRGFLSFALDVPIGRRTWGVALLNLAVGTVGFLGGAFLMEAAGC